MTSYLAGYAINLLEYEEHDYEVKIKRDFDNFDYVNNSFILDPITNQKKEYRLTIVDTTSYSSSLTREIINTYFVNNTQISMSLDYPTSINKTVTIKDYEVILLPNLNSRLIRVYLVEV